MRHRKLGQTDLIVSELGLGTMTFGWTTDENSSHRMLDLAVDAGVNFVDTADIYSRWASQSYAGRSEEIVGSWLQRQPRDHVVVATKVRGPMSDDPGDQGLSRRHIMAAVEGSLRRLRTEYIDLYQTHWPDEETPLEETLHALDDLRRDGKVRFIGCSNSPAWYTMKALCASDKEHIARYQTLQVHYNLVHRAEFERELRPLCVDQHLGVIAYSPLASGFLSGRIRRGASPSGGRRSAGSETIKRYMSDERALAVIDKLEQIAHAYGKTIPQIALAWLVGAPNLTTALLGASTPEQLQETLTGIDFTISDADQSALDDLSKWS